MWWSIAGCSYRIIFVTGVLEKNLGDVEIKRSTLVANAVRTLVADLIEIAHQLPDSIERDLQQDVKEVCVLHVQLLAVHFIHNLRATHSLVTRVCLAGERAYSAQPRKLPRIAG